MAPVQEPFQRLTGILEQVPTIGHLLRLRRRGAGRLGEGGPAIAAETFDLGMLAEPTLEGLAVAAGQ